MASWATAFTGKAQDDWETFWRTHSVALLVFESIDAVLSKRTFPARAQGAPRRKKRAAASATRGRKALGRGRTLRQGWCLIGLIEVPFPALLRGTEYSRYWSTDDR
jgi:hypothetical protein